MATYVSLVNNAIDESGADLALYAEDGSDFTTNTEPMLNRFKTWVARAWKTVQQVAFDWEFLNNQALVTLQPGLMFYSTDELFETALPHSVDIYGTDDAIIYSDVEIDTYKDLTYTQYSDSESYNFGYLDLTASGASPLPAYSFKAGGDYIKFQGARYSVDVSNATVSDTDIDVGETIYIAVTSSEPYLGVSAPHYYEPVPCVVVSATQATNSFSFVTDSPHVFNILGAATGHLYVYRDISTWGGVPVGEVINEVLVATGYIADASINSPIILTVGEYTEPRKSYLHSWKSFLFSEENSSNDYVHEVSEIDNNSFHIIDHEADSPSTARPLTFVPWHIFSVQYDSLTTPPSTPIYITEDNTGRWRLYPHPDRPVTLKFSYSRTPQNLVEWDDEPKGLPADFTDLVMWLAVRMYGEFDEQPSVARRAERYYKDLLQRLQIKYRPKFRMQPKRLY